MTDYRSCLFRPTLPRQGRPRTTVVRLVRLTDSVSAPVFIGLLCLVVALTFAAAPVDASTDSTEDNQVMLPGEATEPAAPEAVSSDPIELIPFSATYKARFSTGVAIRGEAVRSLSRNTDGTWAYRSMTKAFIGNDEEQVVLRWRDNQVIPLSYSHQRTGMLPNPDASTEFAWDKSVATTRYEDEDGEFPISLGVLDSLSYQLQLQQDVRRGMQTMNYPLIHKNKIRHYRFAVLGEEMLETPVGKVRTLKLEKVRDAGKKRKTWFWLAPEWDFILVRFFQREPNGKEYEILLHHAVTGDKTIKLGD